MDGYIVAKLRLGFSKVSEDCMGSTNV